MNIDIRLCMCVPACVSVWVFVDYGQWLIDHLTDHAILMAWWPPQSECKRLLIPSCHVARYCAELSCCVISSWVLAWGTSDKMSLWSLMERTHHFESFCLHDDVIKWKCFPRYWPFVQGIHRWPVNFPHKGQWRGGLMFSFICAWINAWVNNREAGDLRRHCAHYDVTVMNYCNEMARYASHSPINIIKYDFPGIHIDQMTKQPANCYIKRASINNFLNFLLASTINLKLHLWVISLTLNCTKVNFMYMRIMSFIYMFTMWGPAPLLSLTNNQYMVASPMSPRLLWRPPTDATMSMSSYSLYCYSCML